jgi:hypothetical protein
MAKQIARYSVTSGLAGCYMPDNHSGPFSAATSKELADAIRCEIEMAEFPKSAIRQVRLRRLWRYIANHGSSVAHFSIQHAGREIAFHGLTESEFAQAESENL